MMTVMDIEEETSNMENEMDCSNKRQSNETIDRDERKRMKNM